MKNILLLLLAVCSLYCPAQTNPINARFKGGEVKFIGFMSENIKFPEKSSDANRIGYSITGITITPTGDIAEVSTNPLDEDIDRQVIATLLKTKSRYV